MSHFLTQLRYCHFFVITTVKICPMFFLIKFYVFFDRQFPCYKTNCSIFEQFNSILSQQKDFNIYVLIHVLHNIILFFLGVGALLFRFLFVCLFGFVGCFFCSMFTLLSLFYYTPKNLLATFQNAITRWRQCLFSVI